MYIRAFCLLLLTTLTSGCSVFYERGYWDDDFTIYSNRKQELVDEVGRDTERLFEIYETLLNTCAEDHLTIVLRGDGTKITEGKGGTTLGYYMPYWDYICVDTSHRGVTNKDGEMDYVAMRTILVHELAHYFILSKYPGIQKKTWLNEGLAGIFESLLFDDERAELPYLHPLLFSVAWLDIRYDTAESIAELTSMTWGEFHNERKDKHYALAWSLCWYLLVVQQQGHLTISDRVEAMMRMEPEDFVAIQGDWESTIFSFDLEKNLEILSEISWLRLTSEWALRELEILRRAKEEE